MTRNDVHNLATALNGASFVLGAIALTCAATVVGNAGCSEGAGALALLTALPAAGLDAYLLMTATNDKERADASGSVIFDLIGLGIPLVGRGFMLAGTAGRNLTEAERHAAEIGRWFADLHGFGPGVPSTIMDWANRLTGHQQ